MLILACHTAYAAVLLNKLNLTELLLYEFTLNFVV